MRIQQNSATLSSQGPTIRIENDGIDSRFEKLEANSKDLKTNIILSISAVLMMAFVGQIFIR